MSVVGLMGWDAPDWRNVVVDAAGHLQVDVLTAALPTGAATAANQVTEITALQLVDDLRNALGSVNTDDLQVDIKDIAEGEIKLYAYDGAAWQTLLVESNVLKNLRVRLYDGANGVDSTLMDGNDVQAAVRGLPIRSGLMVWVSGSNDWKNVVSPGYTGDGTTGYTMVPIAPWGFNGATWDKLRTYGTGILKVGKGNIGAIPARKTAVGQVVAGAHELHQLCANPSAANAALELTDAIAGGGAVLMDMFFSARETHHYVFDPPIPFATGIYLETFTNLTSVLFCYV